MAARRLGSGSGASDAPVEDPEQLARTVVLRRLSSAPRTRKELADDLGRRAIPEDIVATVLDRFTEVGLIDDAEYARLWVGSRHRSRGTARESLRHELRAKGIDEDAAAEALDTIDDDTERERGAALVRAKLASTSRLEPQARRRRMVSLLLRRGYRSWTAVSIVSEVMAHDAWAEAGLSGVDETA